MLESTIALAHWLQSHNIDPERVRVSVKFENDTDRLRAGFAAADEMNVVYHKGDTYVGPALHMVLHGIKVNLDA